MIAALPPNEEDRLRVLRRYGILDTPPEVAFDRIVGLVSRLLEVPIATVTLVDKWRQWFKARCGIKEQETSRDISFCSHAILSNEITIVPDATRDKRFSDSPLVTAPNGIRFYAGVPLKGFDGSNIGMLCAIDTKPRNFTAEQCSILKELAEIANAELRLRLTVSEKNMMESAIINVGVGVVVTDPSQPGNPIVFCNPAFTKITGYQREEAIGHSCRLLQGRNSDKTEQNKIRQALAERRTYRGQLLNYRKSGEPFWNDLVINPVFDANGRFVHFVGLQNDITERKNAVDALKASYEQLKKLQNLRDSLTHMIVHDLRSPLSVTMGFLDLLKKETEEDFSPLAVELVEQAVKGAEQMNAMITSLLDVGRLESGKMPLNIVKSDLVKLVKSSLAAHLLLKGTCLQLELADAPVWVQCDEALISRVIKNLVENALKFTPSPGKVRVRIESKENAMRLLVIDEGPGIPLEYQSRIFEKFTQVEGTRRRHSTGLGLTFCKLAIEAHGGAIAVESEEGKGSVFWFSLPLR